MIREGRELQTVSLSSCTKSCWAEPVRACLRVIVTQTLGTNSMRALGVRSSYKGRTVDASAMRGDEGRGQLRKASGSR
jgi:hypothetical protein